MINLMMPWRKMISDRGSRREEYVQYVGIVDAELEMQREKCPF
jgi:hypothetical protein